MLFSSFHLNGHNITAVISFSQTLCAEIDIHEAQKDRICQRGQELVECGHPESDQVAFRTQDLQEKYDNLKKLSDDYKAQLDLSLQAKQV